MSKKVTSLDLLVRCWCDMDRNSQTEAKPRGFEMVQSLGGGEYHYIYRWFCRECGENYDEGVYRM